MKKTLLLSVLVLLTLPLISQGKKYSRAMKAEVDQMHGASDPAGELELVGNFEKIASENPDQWLPCYHAARILITGSFVEFKTENREALLDQAKAHVLKAEDLVPEESEVQVLKALYYIGLISIEPESRGPVYYEDAMFAIQKSLELNPENPRAHYMNATWTLNTPDFLGGGPEAARPLLLEAQQKFQDYENEDPFWPVWGEDLVRQDLNSISQ